MNTWPKKAAASGVELLGILTALKADFTNITCRIREKATAAGIAGALFAGGTLDEESLDVIAVGGEKAVSLLKAHGFERLHRFFRRRCRTRRRFAGNATGCISGSLTGISSCRSDRIR